jgi:hypothetical protein
MTHDVLPSTIRPMLAPAFYPHPVASPVRIIETHISYVLLTGDYAYKVKKPVDLGFLDFTTLERRRHFCEEEVRLNSRGAPGMYLGVVPIARAAAPAAGVALGGGGTPVEYAVKMRQFPEDALLSVALERGDVGEADALHLAATVAAYHAESPVVRRDPLGSPDALRREMGRNYRRTEKFAGDLLEVPWLADIERFTDLCFDERSPLMRSRIEPGFVRECHGDLHLGNVCRWEGKTYLFDCIEFNEAFRCVDVICDAAFALMDFDARGYPGLANAFMNGYAEATGDWSGLRLLPLYLCRNAYVRAMVNSILLDATLDPADAGRVRSRATRYYELAWQYARPRHGGLVLTCGASGSGKSTLARDLARRWGAVHLRSDAVRKHLAGVPTDGGRAGDGAYAPEMTRRTYDRLLDLGLALAGEGFVVLLDARYPRAALRAQAYAAAAGRGVPLHVLHCAAPEDVLRGRLAARAAGTDLSDATPDLLAGQLAEQEPFGPAERPHVLELDTRQPVDRLAAQVDAWCRHAGRPR